MSTTSRLRPGLMICTPSLHKTTLSNADKFMRWTRLHFRELLNLPATEHGGKITRTLRFAAPNATGKPGEYFYTILSSDISFWHTLAYHNRSPRLDLENTRDLEDGEEPVGCQGGLMVWDICDAKFAIYEEVQPNNVDVEAYQTLPGDTGPKQLLGISMSGSEAGVRDVQKDLIKQLNDDTCALFSSLYKHGGKEAHPDMHPKIDHADIGGGKWLLLLLVASKDSETVPQGSLDTSFAKWMHERDIADLKYGIWSGEVDLS